MPGLKGGAGTKNGNNKRQKREIHKTVYIYEVEPGNTLSVEQNFRKMYKKVKDKRVSFKRKNYFTGSGSRGKSFSYVCRNAVEESEKFQFRFGAILRLRNTEEGQDGQSTFIAGVHTEPKDHLSNRLFTKQSEQKAKTQEEIEATQLSCCGLKGYPEFLAELETIMKKDRLDRTTQLAAELALPTKQVYFKEMNVLIEYVMDVRNAQSIDDIQTMVLNELIDMHEIVTQNKIDTSLQTFWQLGGTEWVNDLMYKKKHKGLPKNDNLNQQLEFTWTSGTPKWRKEHGEANISLPLYDRESFIRFTRREHPVWLKATMKSSHELLKEIISFQVSFLEIQPTLKSDVLDELAQDREKTVYGKLMLEAQNKSNMKIGKAQFTPSKRQAINRCFNAKKSTMDVMAQCFSSTVSLADLKAELIQKRLTFRDNHVDVFAQDKEFGDQIMACNRAMKKEMKTGGTLYNWNIEKLGIEKAKQQAKSASLKPSGNIAAQNQETTHTVEDNEDDQNNKQNDGQHTTTWQSMDRSSELSLNCDENSQSGTNKLQMKFSFTSSALISNPEDLNSTTKTPNI